MFQSDFFYSAPSSSSTSSTSSSSQPTPASKSDNQETSTIVPFQQPSSQHTPSVSSQTQSSTTSNSATGKSTIAPPRFPVKIPPRVSEAAKPVAVPAPQQNQSMPPPATKLTKETRTHISVLSSASDSEDDFNGDDIFEDVAPKSVTKKRRVTSKRSNPLPSASTPSKKSRTHRVKAVASIFPTSYGSVATCQRITLYAKRSHDGVPGIIFENLDNRAVIHAFTEDYTNPQALRVGDVVVSVNHLDARYVKFDQVLAAMCLGAIAPSAAQLGANGTIALRNKVSEEVVCVVFARPIIAAGAAGKRTLLSRASAAATQSVC